MALAFMNVGEKRRIKSIRGKDDIIRHLQEMGFAPGTEVEMVGGCPSGMILLVKGTRIALDRTLASKILVA